MTETKFGESRPAMKSSASSPQNVLRIITCVAILLLVAPARGQESPVNADTSNVAVAGKTQPASIKLYRVDGAAWKEAAQSISFSGTENRLRFKVTPHPPMPDIKWSIKIIDQSSGATLWEYEPPPGEESVADGQTLTEERIFWSTILYAKDVRVIVNTRSEQNGLKIVVDSKATFTPPSKDLSAVGTPYVSIIGQESSVVSAGRAVVLLRTQPDDGGNRFCTGFLIGLDLVITNRHCATTGSEAGYAVAQFDIDKIGATASFTIGVKELVLASCDLDFVILRLLKRPCVAADCKGPGDRQPIKLAAVMGSLTPASKLAVIQHPGAYPKMVAYKCDPGQFNRMGNSTNLTDFGHKCNTDEGSSGSPVFLLNADGSINKLVGLHHWGTRKDTVTTASVISENLAVNIGAIISFVKANKPGLAAELGIQ